MSIDYVLREPLPLAEVSRRSGWLRDRHTEEANGVSLDDHACLSDGVRYAWADLVDGLVVGFSTYAGNDASRLAAAVDAVDEYDDEYLKLIGFEDDED